jgi:photosystem II stability/assembly factor-like uncharacterized protein
MTFFRLSPLPTSQAARRAHRRIRRRIERATLAALGAVAVALSPPAQAKTTWEGTLANSMPSQDNAIFFVHALDGEHAWTVGKRSGGGSGDEVVGLRTTNGTSWNQMQLPQGGSFFPVIPTALVFVDADRGYLAATEVEGLSETNKIFESTDGGMSWTEVAQVDGAVLRFQKLPGGEIFGTGGGYVVHSADGQSWSSVAVPEPAADVRPEAIAMLNADCGWLVGGLPADPDAGRDSGADGAVWYTEDGGQSWTVIAEGLPYFLRDASFVAGDTGWAVGQKNGNQAVLAVTTDDGATWTEVSVPDHPALPDVCMMSQCIDEVQGVTDMTHVRFWDPQRGIASGLACTGGCGPGETPTYLTVFLRTYDGGATWEYDADYEAAMPDIDMQMMSIPGELVGLHSMSFPDPNHGFLAGQYEMILRYDADWIEDPAQSPPACGSSAAGDGGIGPSPDGGTPSGDGGTDPDLDADGLAGCGCRAGGSPAVPALWLLFGALLFGARCFGARRFGARRRHRRRDAPGRP